MAAEQGHDSGQLALGYMHFNGYGVPEDFVEAYARFSVAVTLGNVNAKKWKDHLTESMTKEQIAEAQKRSKEIWAELEARK